MKPPQTSYNNNVLGLQVQRIVDLPPGVQAQVIEPGWNYCSRNTGQVCAQWIGRLHYRLSNRIVLPIGCNMSTLAWKSALRYQVPRGDFAWSL